MVGTMVLSTPPSQVGGSSTDSHTPPGTIDFGDWSNSRIWDVTDSPLYIYDETKSPLSSPTINMESWSPHFDICPQLTLGDLALSGWGSKLKQQTSDDPEHMMYSRTLLEDVDIAQELHSPFASSYSLRSPKISSPTFPEGNMIKTLNLNTQRRGILHHVANQGFAS